MKDTVNILGVDFVKLTFNNALNIIERQVKFPDKKLFHVITANPEIILSVKEDIKLKNVLEDAGLVTADGVGIIMAAKWKRNPLPERVAGSDMLIKLFEKGNEEGWSFYFFGAKEEVSKKACENVAKDYPNINIVGRHNGYYNKDEEDKIINEIAEAKPDILIVALGAPRAEKWVYDNKNRLNAKVAMGVGGCLDIVAGVYKRAPKAWQKLNLEWLYRLIQEPSRWRRQLILPKFAVKALVDAFKSR